MNFEINLIFLIKLFFSTWPKGQDKNLNILRTIFLGVENPTIKDRYFELGRRIGMNVGVLWETSVRFLSVVLQLFPKYSQSYANLNVKSSPNFNSP